MRKTSISNAVMVLSGGDGYVDLKGGLHSEIKTSKSQTHCDFFMSGPFKNACRQKFRLMTPLLCQKMSKNLQKWPNQAIFLKLSIETTKNISTSKIALFHSEMIILVTYVGKIRHFYQKVSFLTFFSCFFHFFQGQGSFRCS